MAGAPVGALRVTLGANTAQFEQGMRRAQAVARRSGQDIERSYVRMTQSGIRAFSTLRASIGAFAAIMAGGALARYGRDALQWAAGLSETAQQIGVTVEQLQVLRLAAEQNGASVEGMERAVAILNRTLGQAQAGLPAAVQSFRALGISQEQLQSFRNAGEALPRVMEAIKGFRTEAQQAAAAQRVFGRGAAELLPLLTQGAAGWDRATQAAIRNGMITQEQAERADQAADAIGALAASLRVQLAGALVDALPAIQLVVTALAGLARVALWVIGLLGRVVAEAPRLSANVIMSGARQVTEQQFQAGIQRWGNPARGTPEYQRMIRDPEMQRLGRNFRAARGGDRQPATAPPGGNTELDLSSPSRGGRQNDEAARRRHQFEQETRRLQIDNLRAQMENTQAIDERNYIQGQIVTIENDQWLADVRFRQSQDDLSETEAAILIEAKNRLLASEAIGRALEYNHEVRQQENQRADQQEEYARDRMRFEADMAQTMEERRRIELELLRITMEQRRNALARLIREANERRDPAAAAMAQLELDNLGGVERNETRRIMRDTRGPLESFISDLPQTAEQIRESLQSIAVDGLQSISDGLVDVITGARKMKDVFKSVVTSIISDLLRIQIQKAIIGPLANALGGLFSGAGGAGSDAGVFGSLMGGGLAGARAAGGPVLPGRTYLIGEKGPELLRMGGAGGQVIANDNMGGSSEVHIHQSFKFDGVAVTKDEFVQGLMATRNATMQAVREARRRSS